ncbi:MAG: DUF4191 family protein [Actinobacteria bacterium]|jgi:hypothetical protein|uniref:Unannotated protein n=1 Tax=freshwater metagenome TaxID=449393 RepID=A0A6J6I2I3_9ZZZZ|nr:DUF4191 family protein [Actinomycetota bacterium]MTA66785.1 DUF4191 family protein [Actinomycetota bacterium]
MATKNTAETPAKPPRFERLRQIGQAYSMTAKVDKFVGLITFAFFMLGWGVFVAVGIIVKLEVYFAVIGFAVGILVALIMFGRRVERAAYAQVAGQPGAGAAVAEGVRGWTVTPAVAATRQQDLVSRAVGRPGIVLIGEGDINRVRGLLQNETKRLSKLVADTPVHEIIVGEGPGTIPLAKVQRSLQKLPRALKPAEVTEVRRRLAALGGMMEQMPIPKGPMPKGGRVPRGKQR